LQIGTHYNPQNNLSLHHGSCLNFLKTVPNESADLVITSPPYNIGKSFVDGTDLKSYIEQQSAVIAESVRILENRGSLCWQVGNYVNSGEIIPMESLTMG